MAEQEEEFLSYSSNPFDQSDEIVAADYGRAVASGAYGLVGAAGAAAQYFTGAEEDSISARIRRWGEEGADEQIKKMSARAQKAITANILPSEGKGDIWDDDISKGGAIALKAASSIPSIAASLIPGGLAARLAVGAGASAAAATAVGTAVGGAAAGAQTAGDVFEDIQNGILSMSDEELRKESPVYDGFRDMGFPEEEAKRRTVEKAAGYKPVYMAALTALASKWGVEGLVAGRVAGAAGIKGAAKRTAAGALGEATTEGAEEAAADILKQKGEADTRMRDFEVDYQRALEASAQGFIVGAPMGGTVGLLTGGQHKTGDADLDIANAQPPPEEEAPPMVLTGKNRVRSKPRTGEELADEFDNSDKGIQDLDDQITAVETRGRKVEPATPGATAPVPGANLREAPQRPSLVITDPVDPALRAVTTPVEPAAPPAPPPVADAPPVASPLPTVDELGSDPDEDIVPPVPPVPLTPEQQVLTQASPPSPPAPIPQEVSPGMALAAEPTVPTNDQELLPPTVEPTQPVEPAPVAAASVPASAPVTPVPVTSAAPRVLEDEAAAARMQELFRQREEEAAAQELAQEVPEGRQRSGPRTSKTNIAAAVDTGAVGTLAKEPEKFGTAADRKQVWATAAKLQKEAEKAKKPLDPVWAELLTLRGKMTGQGAKQKANNARWMELRQQIAQKAEAAPAPVVKGVERVKAVRKSQQDKQAEAAGRIIQNVPLDAAKIRNSAQIREYARALLQQAKDAKVNIPSQVSEDTDISLAHLAHARGVQGTTDETRLSDFLASDLLLRSGDDKLVRDYRKAEAKKSAPAVREDIQKDEQPTLDKGLEKLKPVAYTDESGADRQELLDRDSDGSAPSTVVEADDLGVVDRDEDYQEPTVTPRERPKVEVGEDAYTVAAPKRPIVVEKRRNRGDDIKRKVAERTRTGTAVTERAARNQLQEIREQENADVLSDRPVLPGPSEPVRIPGTTIRDTSLGSLLAEQKIDSSSPVGTFHNFIRNRIKKLAGDVPVLIVDEARANALWERTDNHDTQKPPYAWYDPALDEIVIREGYADTPMVIHEGVHAAYSHRIFAGEMTGDAVYTELNNIYLAVYKQFNREARAAGLDEVTVPYGLTNIQEMVAEAFSNAEFQQLMARTPMFGQGQSRVAGFAWSRFIDSVKKVLGLSVPNNALERVIRVTSVIDEQSANRGTGNVLAMAGPTKIKLSEFIGDEREVADIKLTRFGLAARTFDQIRQAYKGLFPGKDGDSVEIIVEALQRQEGATNQMRKVGQQWAAKFQTIKEKDPAQAARMAELMIDATMTGVYLVDKPNATTAELLAANPHLGDAKSDKAANYQARARLPQLQNKFMGLKPESRRFILESAQFYRDTQNEITKGLVSNILEVLPIGLDPMQLGKLTSQVMNGTLDEEARGLIDNDVIFGELKKAQGLRTVKGLYFPLMRHGNYVVTAKVAWPKDLHGGKVVGDYIEWAAAKDKDARKQYRSFAEDTSHELDIQAVDKIRRLPDGTIVAAKDVGNRPHEVVYRARIQRQATYFFDSEREAVRFARQAKASGEHETVSPALQRADFLSRGDVSTQTMAGLMSSIEKQNLPDGTKGLMRAAISQAAVRMMTGNRIQQRALVRRNIKGASTDIVRNMVDYAEASSRYRAKIRYMPVIREQIAEMRRIIKESSDKQWQQRGQVLAEVEKRINDHNVMSPSDLPKPFQDIMVLSYLDKLFSPAYSIVNAMQPWMVTMPVLAGEFGAFKAAAAMTRAYNALGFAGTTWGGIANTATAAAPWNIRKGAIDTRDLTGSVRSNLAKEKDGAQLTVLFDELTSRGIIDDQSGFEISSAIASGRGVWGTGLAKMDRIARQLPLAVEVMNRSATAVAAYRLAKGMNMTDEQARAHAVNTVQNTQGDYSAVNQPRIFNKPFLRPALQFKKYAQMMSALLVDMFQRSFGRNTPRRERVKALKQLTGILSVQIAMAGAMGLPGLELIKVGFMAAAAIGLGDGWEEEERKLRTHAEAVVGKDWAEMLSKGIVSRYLNLDLSSRVSLADMWTFGEPKSNDREGIQSYLFQFFGGAPASLMIDWLDGARAAAEGDFKKAFTLMIPNKFASDVLKATQAGEKPTSPKGPYEVTLQTLGFRSGRMAEEGDKIGASVARTKMFEQRRKELSRAYINAETKGELLKIKQQIKKHNETKGVEFRQKVSIGGLDNARRKNEEYRRSND